MVVDWTAVRQAAYSRVEAELQKQEGYARDNPEDYESITVDEVVDQMFETLGG